MTEKRYSRKSLFGNHTNHYDSSGKKIGESRESLFGDHTNVYDSNGNKIGESRDSLFGNHTNQFDAQGRKVGESHQSLWGDHVNHYDQYGNKIGESRDATFSDSTVSHWNDPRTSSGSGFADTSIPESDILTNGPSWTNGRFDQITEHFAVALRAGGVIAVVLVVTLLCSMALSMGVPAFGRVQGYVTSHGWASLKFLYGWPLGFLLSLLLSQIFFSKNKETSGSGIVFGITGFVLGLVLFVILIVVGIENSLIAYIPGAAMGIGVVIGVLTSWKMR